MILLLTFAVTWLCVGLGLSAKSVETASNSPMFLIILPFLSSGFVPTPSLPTGLRWFAEYQPFTPVNETRAADRDEDRRQPGHHGRLVRRGRRAVLRVVAAAVRAGTEATLSWRRADGKRRALRNTPNNG